MKTINYIGKDFIEKMKNERIAIKATDKLMERLEELGVVWSNKKKPTKYNGWKDDQCNFIRLYDNATMVRNSEFYFRKEGYELYEYQPKTQLTEKERIERAIERKKVDIERLSKRLEELNKPKWDIYTKKPQIGEEFWIIDIISGIVLWKQWEKDYDDENYWRLSIFGNYFFHKTKESAELELDFRAHLEARRKEFEEGKSNWRIYLNSDTRDLELTNNTKYIEIKYYFTRKNAQWLIDNFPQEVIKAVLFDIKGE